MNMGKWTCMFSSSMWTEVHSVNIRQFDAYKVVHLQQNASVLPERLLGYKTCLDTKPV